MKRSANKALACLLALAMLFSFAIPALAENGPYVPEEGGWSYARLELVELDENGEPITVINEEYGYPEQKSVKLYADGAAVAQEGAVYDPASNTLTLTDFNGNYMLRVNLMGDDFTLCVKGECSLAGIVVNGGGIIQPVWSCGLRVTGDGTLTVNADKKLDSGLSFQPQDDDVYFTVDKEVTLNVSGKENAIEVWGYTGTLDFTVDGKSETVTGEPAVREHNLYLRGYSNPMEENLRLADCAADPEGIYTINEWFRDETPVGVTVERYIYAAKYDMYLKDYAWEQAHATDEYGGEVRFETLADAAAAGFTVRKDAEDRDCWLDDVIVLADHHDIEIREDADGNRYGVTYGYDDERVMRDIALTFAPLDEIPGEYVFLFAKGVDPETLTKILVEETYEDQFDYYYPNKEFTHEGDTGDKYVYADRIDVSLDESAFPWDQEITPEAMFDLLCDGLLTVETKGVYLRFRRVTETDTGKYQTLPITAARLYSDDPFALFAGDKEYEIELTFFTGTDAASGKPIRFADETALYVNGKKVSSGAPLAADVDGMIVKGDIVLSAGSYKKPAEAPAIKLGDVDGDGNITAGDARLCLRRAVDLEAYAENSREFLACDVDFDGKVTAKDARSILRAAVELEDPGTWVKA